MQKRPHYHHSCIELMKHKLKNLCINLIKTSPNMHYNILKRHANDPAKCLKHLWSISQPYKAKQVEKQWITCSKTGQLLEQTNCCFFCSNRGPEIWPFTAFIRTNELTVLSSERTWAQKNSRTNPINEYLNYQESKPKSNLIFKNDRILPHVMQKCNQKLHAWA